MRDARPAVVAAALVLAFGVWQALAANVFPDLFIFHTAARLALAGESPYHTPAIRAAVAAQYPDQTDGPDAFANNCGFFMPPGAVVLFLPLGALAWEYAKLLYVAVGALAAFAVARTPALLRPAAQPPAPPLVGRLVPFALVLNFLALDVLRVGQTPVVAAGCVAAGLAAFGRGWNVAGVALWAVPFVKPHVALALLPLAWYLGGWKRAAALAAAVAALNVAGAVLVGGSPLFLLDYAALAADGYRGVAFNRVERACEMTSWNRLLYVVTGGHVAVQQTAATVVASYAVGVALAAGRCYLGRVRPSAAWAVALAATLAVVCPQVLAYELIGLALAVPWVRDLFAVGRTGWAWAAVTLLGVQLVPFQTMDAVGVDWHRPAAAMGFALVVLCGPLRSGTQED